jgi:DNA topoisomerase-1
VAINAPSSDPALDSIESARAAGLRYVSDSAPGIARKRRGRSFAYVAPGGAPLRDPAELARIRALAVPPAWTNVWICPDARGHVQATGRDARGRKQYRYHAKYRTVRERAKFGRMIEFGAALPKIRKRVAADLRREGLPKEKVLATVVRLLDTTFIRIGNGEYAKDNGSFGLTTLRARHVAFNANGMRFEFKGKSGKVHVVDVHDKRLARIVRNCRNLPGQELFQYFDETGARRAVDSSDVNDYIREVSGSDFTAKDFRTWAGTVLGACALREIGPAASQTAAKRNAARAIEAVSHMLGNTPAVCRASYVHPAVLDAYAAGTVLEANAPRAARGSANGLRADERAVLAMLRRLQRGKPALKRAA